MKTYLVDFDGTLVDSMPTFSSVMLRVLDKHKVSYPNDIIKIITPLGYAGTGKYFRDTLGLDLPLEEIGKEIYDYALDAYENVILAKENVIEVLHKLKSQGDDLNILTASPHPMLDPCLKRLGIYDLFTNVWSCEDFNTTKADPDIYRMAAKKIGRDIGEIIFIDDNLGADTTAKSAGMIVYGVYDESSKEYVEEIKRIADKYIYDFTELL